MLEGKLEAAIAPGTGLQHLDARSDHLGPDAVAGDGGNAQPSHLAPSFARFFLASGRTLTGAVPACTAAAVAGTRLSSAANVSSISANSQSRKALMLDRVSCPLAHTK